MSQIIVRLQTYLFFLDKIFEFIVLKPIERAALSTQHEFPLSRSTDLVQSIL